MSCYDLYGFKVKDINIAKEIVENALSIQMEGRDSDFVGDYFMFKSDEGEEFVIKENYDEDEGAFREPDYQYSPILLYIDESTEERVKSYELTLLAHEEVELLRREDF